MKSILLFCLIACTLCTTKRPIPGEIADIYKGIKSKIYKCVLDSDKASSALKELANKSLNLEETSPLNFFSIELVREDRQIIRDCKRQEIRKRISSQEAGSITPLGIENAVHSKSFPKSYAKTFRKLSSDNEFGRLGAFNIGGIFPCIENAQPAIVVIRDSVNFIKSRDYTGAIINIYDNFSAISEGLTYCINSIFPPD